MRVVGDDVIQVSAIQSRDANLAQPRAIGTAALCVRADVDGKTRLETLRQAGSMKLIFPKSYQTGSRQNGIEAVIVNTAGGITGGDLFEITARVRAGASLTLTTQAAERAYRAQPGEVGQITTKISVEAGGHLQWMPQELILFDRCNIRRRLEIDLAADARLALVEPMVFGRTAMGEDLRDVHFRDRIRITCEGRPIYIDGMDLSGDAAAHLDRAAIANGARAMASVVIKSPDADRHLDAIRARLPATAGASLLAPSLLVVRLLARDGWEMRRSLVPLLDHLSETNLPLSWRL